MHRPLKMDTDTPTHTQTLTYTCIHTYVHLCADLSAYSDVCLPVCVILCLDVVRVCLSVLLIILRKCLVVSFFLFEVEASRVRMVIPRFVQLQLKNCWRYAAFHSHVLMNPCARSVRVSRWKIPKQWIKFWQWILYPSYYHLIPVACCFELWHRHKRSLRMGGTWQEGHVDGPTSGTKQHDRRGHWRRRLLLPAFTALADRHLSTKQKSDFSFSSLLFSLSLYDPLLSILFLSSICPYPSLVSLLSYSLSLSLSILFL